MNDKVFHGALALIKVQGVVIGKMRSVSCQENFARQEVRGLGTILPSEAPVTTWTGTLSCEYMSVNFANEGIKNALRRYLPNLASQVLNGEISFEDQLVLDSDKGVQVDIFKKVEDVIDANGNIKPKLVPYAVVRNCMIESDSFNVSEGSLAGHSQSFKYLKPVMTNLGAF
jgi:hypothetical protein